MKAAWDEYLARPRLQDVLVVMTALAKFQGFCDAVDETVVDSVFWLSAGSGFGDIGIEAEKFIENVAAGSAGSESAKRIAVLQEKLKARKKQLSDKRREAALKALAPKKTTAKVAKPAWMMEMEVS